LPGPRRDDDGDGYGHCGNANAHTNSNTDGYSDSHTNTDAGTFHVTSIAVSTGYHRRGRAD
jgi:hypothetical protein